MQSEPFIGIFYRYLHIVRGPYICVSIDDGNVPRDINVTKAYIQGSRYTYLACPSTCTGYNVQKIRADETEKTLFNSVQWGRPAWGQKEKGIF